RGIAELQERLPSTQELNEMKKKKMAYKKSLEEQIREKEEKMMRDIIRLRENERRDLMNDYNPFGKPGAGAPLIRVSDSFSPIKEISPQKSESPIKSYDRFEHLVAENQKRGNFARLRFELYDPNKQEELRIKVEKQK